MLMRPSLQQWEKSRPGSFSVALCSFLAFHEKQGLGLYYFTEHAACVTSEGIAGISSQKSLIQTIWFSLSTTKGVCEALFQNAALRLASELGWGVVSHWLLNLRGIISDALGSSATGLVTFAVRVLLLLRCIILICWEFSFLSHSCLFGNCSWTKLITWSFRLHCEIPQSQPFMHRKKRAFCLKSCFFLLLLYMSTVQRLV